MEIDGFNDRNDGFNKKMIDLTQGEQVVLIEIKREGSQDRFLKNPLFQTVKPALLSATGSKSETSVSATMVNNTSQRTKRFGSKFESN